MPSRLRGFMKLSYQTMESPRKMSLKNLIVVTKALANFFLL
jgi:hypothetical protein